MGEALDRLAPWLLDLAIANAAWLSLVMIAMVACRQPVRRRDLARAGVLGSALLVPLSLLPMARVASWPRWIGAALGPLCDRPALRWLGGLGVLCPVRCVVIGYAALIGLGLGWIALGAWALRRLVRESAPPSARAVALYRSLPFEGRGDRRPRLRVSGRIGRPVLIGPASRTILIPDGWDRDGAAAEERLRLALLHELAHAERRDDLFYLVAGLVQAAWLPLPMMWWVRHQLGTDQEYLADERASKGFGASTSYASSLVAMAGVALGGGVGALPGGPTSRAGPAPESSDGSTLVRRIAMLVRCPFPVEMRPPLWWRVAVPSAALLALLPIARMTATGGIARAAPGVATVPPARRSELIRVPEVELAPRAGRTPAERLPIPLPAEFEVSFDVFGTPATLGAMAVAGHRLGPGPGPSAAEEAGEPSWHSARLIVEAGAARLWIDGEPAATARDDSSPPDWLSIRPAPDRRARIRNLVLTWTE